MMLASYEYPHQGEPFWMSLALLALAIFVAAQLGYEKPWESVIVKSTAIFGVCAVGFMLWASSTG